MAVSYELEEGILSITASGKYAPEDIPRQFMAALSDPRCPTPVGLLLDVRGSAELATRSPEQVRRVSEFLLPHAPRIGRRCAVLVASDVQFGMSRMGAVFCEGVGVEAEVFRCPEAAARWLKAALPGAGEN